MSCHILPSQPKRKKKKDECSNNTALYGMIKGKEKSKQSLINTEFTFI